MESDTLKKKLTNACNSVMDQLGKGQVASYIPALARIDPKKFGASILTVDGIKVSYGDASEPFSIQSISKVFALTNVLNILGDKLWNRINHEPSGNAFNSIVQLELEKGIPRNPFINAGALVLSDIMLRGHSPESCISSFLDFIQIVGDDPSIFIDEEVAKSELETAHRNASLANFMKSCNNIDHLVLDVLNVYCHNCSITMSCEQLSRAFLFLAKEGLDPLSTRRVIPDEKARRINSIMMLCGHYDASGDFAYRVGLPGKSGVGGGIVVIIPDVGVVTVWSPGLNKNGNSLVGTSALEAITRSMGWNIL